MLCTNESVAAWINHIDGAVALVRMRGQEQFANPQSRHLAHAVRTAALNCCVQRSKPMEAPYPDDWDSSYETNAANRLTQISCPLPGIRARATDLRSSNDVHERGLKACDLIRDAQAVDAELEKWFLTLPEMWGYLTAYMVREIPSDLVNADAWVGPVHIYDDLISANVINDCRLARIFCQAVISDCTDWAEEAEMLSETEVEEHRQNARYVTQQAVDEICASVPFHISPDMLDARRQAQPQGQDTAGKWACTTAPLCKFSELIEHTASAAAGGYFLVWPLYVCLSAKGISDKQKQWMYWRLNYIGEEFGLTQAQVLVLAQRQVVTCSPSYP
jgi:hypothetical protein